MNDVGDGSVPYDTERGFAEDLACAERLAKDVLDACERLADGFADGWRTLEKVSKYAAWAGMLTSEQARHIFMIELHSQAASRMACLLNDRAMNARVTCASCIASCLFNAEGRRFPASKVARNLRAEAGRIEKTLQMSSSDAPELLNGLTARLRECATYLEVGPRGRPSGAVSNFPAELIHRAIAANTEFVGALSDESLAVALVRRFAPDLAEYLGNHP